MRSGVILLSALVLLSTPFSISFSASGACSCRGVGGGGASYDYLGDMAFNGMLNQFEDMMRSTTSVQTYPPDECQAEPSAEGGDADSVVVGQEAFADHELKNGRWSINLDGSVSAEVYLSTVEEAAFGWGSVNDGVETIAVTARGWSRDEEMTLDLVTLGGGRLYRINLEEREAFEEGGAFTGSYEAFEAEGVSWSGSANGSFVPSEM